MDVGHAQTDTRVRTDDGEIQRTITQAGARAACGRAF